MNNETCLTPEQEREVLKQVDIINYLSLDGSWGVIYKGQDWMHVNFSILTPGDDVQVDPVSNYLVQNYSTAATSVPNFVRCEGYEEALYFLDVFKKRMILNTPFSYKTVVEAAVAIEREGMMDAWYGFTDDDQGWEKGRLTDGEIIYWWRDSLPRWAGENNMVMTASWSNGYCHYGEIPEPDTPNCLLFAITSTGGTAETEVPWETGHDDNRGLGEEGSLEEYLCLQLLCWRNNATPRTDKRSEGEPAYVYVQYAAIAGAWMEPKAANLEYFERAIQRDDHESYYKYTTDWDDWREGAYLLPFLRDACKDAVEQEDDEALQRGLMYRMAFNDPELQTREDWADLFGMYMNWRRARYERLHGSVDTVPQDWHSVTDYARDRKRKKEQERQA